MTFKQLLGVGVAYNKFQEFYRGRPLGYGPVSLAVAISTIYSSLIKIDNNFFPRSVPGSSQVPTDYESAL